MSGRLLIPFALSALLIASGRAEAQDRSRLVLGGTLGFSNVTQKTTLDTSKMTGPLVGIDVGIRFWRAELRGRYVQGGLDSDGSGQDTDLVEGELMLGVWPTDVFALKLGPRARSFVTNTGTVRWLFWELRARAEASVSSSRSLRSYIEGWYAFSGDVSSAADAFGKNLGIEGGLAIAIPSTPLNVRLSYRIDKGTLAEEIRTEAVDQLLLTVGIGR